MGPCFSPNSGKYGFEKATVLSPRLFARLAKGRKTTSRDYGPARGDRDRNHDRECAVESSCGGVADGRSEHGRKYCRLFYTLSRGLKCWCQLFDQGVTIERKVTVKRPEAHSKILIFLVFSAKEAIKFGQKTRIFISIYGIAPS